MTQTIHRMIFLILTMIFIRTTVDGSLPGDIQMEIEIMKHDIVGLKENEDTTKIALGTFSQLIKTVAEDSRMMMQEVSKRADVNHEEVCENKKKVESIQHQSSTITAKLDQLVEKEESLELQTQENKNLTLQSIKLVEQEIETVESVQNSTKHKIESVRNSTKRAIEEVHMSTKHKIELVEKSMENKIESMQNSTKHEIESVQNSTKHAIEEVHMSTKHKIESVEKSTENKIESVQNSTKHEIESVQNSTKHAIEEVHMSTKHKIESIEKSTENKIESVQNSTKHEIESVQNSTKHAIEEVHMSTKHKIESVEKSTENKIESVQNSTKHEIESVQNSTKHAIESMHMSTKHKIESVEKSTENKIESVQSSTKYAIESMQKSTDRKMDSMKTTIDALTKQVDQLKTRSIIDQLHPIGSLYLSFASVSPPMNGQHGVAWEVLPEGYTLMTANEGNSGKTSGQSRLDEGATEGHVLTVGEMPSHSHQVHGHVYVNEDTGTYLGNSGIPYAYNTNPYTTSTGGSQAHNHRFSVLNQKILVWKRTA